MANPRRIPGATYRLQLRREFPFSAATDVIPYLHNLGISDLYLSPIYYARPGSSHGYDVLDHTRLNPELGDESELRFLLDTAHAHEMGVLLDLVPNHMCIAGDASPRWREVLEDGPAASAAAYFDIDWDPPKPELSAKVLLPFLDEQYGRVLESELSIAFRHGDFVVRWNGGELPFRQETWGHILRPAIDILRENAGSEDPALIELESILRAVTHMLSALRGSAAELERHHEKEAIRRRLVNLAADSPAVASALAAAVNLLNGVRGVPQSYDALERLMNDQVYRLADWRVAAQEINYRRFFDINELAAVRVENEQVFAAIHALPLSLTAHPAFAGFRVDHLDGLADPKRYLDVLQAAWRKATGTREGGGERCFVLVEKILASNEDLRPDFAADGTTGYDFIRLLAGLLVTDEGFSPLCHLVDEIAGPLLPFAQVAADSKHHVLDSTLAAELTVLARRMDSISEQHRYTRDFTMNSIHAALAEVVAGFSVYRTYVREDDQDKDVATADIRDIRQAITQARHRTPLINASLFHFIESVLLHRDPPGLQAEQIRVRREFVTRFQQLTSPVFAKGIEDTAFYRYMPLVALNEVGGDPTRWQLSDSDMHAAFNHRGATSPATLSATATHDTKRGEDARARLYVLSEVADAWAKNCKDWKAMNQRFRADVDESPSPDAAEEYLLYQTLVASWPMNGFDSEPDYGQRIAAYMTKARHEAKRSTSYINPNVAYEEAAEAFVRQVMDGTANRPFLQKVEVFVGGIKTAGFCNSLAQLVLKLAAPGIPDFFQGRELWDFSLVDPDNRRLVEYHERPVLLERLRADVKQQGGPAVERWFLSPEDGKIKMWVTAAGLGLRRSRPALFQQNGYEPLVCRGPKAKHTFAFARRKGNQAAIVLVSRHLAAFSNRLLGPAWAETYVELPAELQDTTVFDVLTERNVPVDGRSLSVEETFRHLPVALLETPK